MQTTGEKMNHLQKPGEYAVGDDHTLLPVTAHDGVLDKVERLIAFRVVLRVQVVDVVTRRLSVHHEYRMRHHNNNINDNNNLLLLLSTVFAKLSELQSSMYRREWDHHRESESSNLDTRTNNYEFGTENESL